MPRNHKKGVSYNEAITQKKKKDTPFFKLTGQSAWEKPAHEGQIS